MMHSICHRKIHATFTDQELRDHYHSIERRLEHEDIRTFVEWVRKKPPGFHVATKMSERRRTRKSHKKAGVRPSPTDRKG